MLKYVKETLIFGCFAKKSPKIIDNRALYGFVFYLILHFLQVNL